MTDYMKQYRHWLDSPALTEEEWNELSAIDGDVKQIESRFFAPLQFGTAGLRGIMGMGINRMNRHVVKHATQAFANVISAEGVRAKAPRHSNMLRLPPVSESLHIRRVGHGGQR
jgi:phosphoglucomutase